MPTDWAAPAIKLERPRLNRRPDEHGWTGDVAGVLGCWETAKFHDRVRAAKWATLPPSAVAAPLSSAPPAPPPTACVGVRGVRETARETASLRKGASAAFNTHRKAISQQPRYYIPIRDT